MTRSLSLLSFCLLGGVLGLQACGGDDASPDEPTTTDREAESEEGPRGRWVEPRGRGKRDAALQEQLQRLEAIGYAGGSVEADEGDTGILRHDEERAQPGLNFYTSGHSPGATLMDMRGEVLHTWHVPFAQAFPGRELGGDPRGQYHWRRAYLLPGGDVLAVYGGLGLVRVTRDSQVVWAYSELAHHDLHLLPNGEIYTLIRVAKADPKPIAEDFVVHLDAQGRELGRWSVLEAVRESDFASIWNAAKNDQGDIFHTNSVRVLAGHAAERNPAFQAGRVLVSMRRLNALAVLDLETTRCVWALKGSFWRQHDPRILENGNLLFFDNNKRPVGSRVIELDVADGSEVWSYAGSEEQPFWSKSCGVATRLAGGNTLITETDQGRAFEVTPGKELVWEFQNPHRAGPDKELIAVLFEVQRLPLEADWGQGDD